MDLDINYSEGKKWFLKARRQNKLQSEVMKMASAAFLCLTSVILGRERTK